MVARIITRRQNVTAQRRPRHLQFGCGGGRVRFEIEEASAYSTFSFQRMVCFRAEEGWAPLLPNTVLRVYSHLLSAESSRYNPGAKKPMYTNSGIQGETAWKF